MSTPSDPYEPPRSDLSTPVPDLSGQVVGGYRVFKRPRLTGVGMLALSALLYGVMWAFLQLTDMFGVILLVLNTGIVPMALFQIVVGQPRDANGEPASWWKKGYGTSFIVGCCLGLALALHLWWPF